MSEVYKSKIESKSVDELFQAMLDLKTVEECYRFFDDLCTYGEVQTMAQRYEVAKLLTEGHTYNTISAETGASTATITRVNKALSYGSGGYKLAMARAGKHK